MKSSELIEEVRRLDPEARLDLVNRLWAEVSSDPDISPLSDSDRDELDRRIAALDAGDDPGRPWSVIKQGLLDQL